MFLRILKKDIKRKKTMNIILLIFVILAVTFMASSANNLITVSTALDNYFEKAGIPDYWFATMNALDIAKFEEFAEENEYDYHVSQLIQIDPKNVLVEGKKLDYSSTLALSELGGIKIFDKNNEEITHINDGEIYVPDFIFVSPENDFHEGGKISVSQNGMKKEFIIKGYTKDALFGSEMVGMTRFLISENDMEMFGGRGALVCSAVGVYTNDADYRDHFNELGINTVMSIERSMFKMIYIMDILIAATLLVVSVCLILISMVVLRFIINFTITGEFREIGVMKAIGIKNNHIRGLYIVKYLAISAIGTSVGLVISFPFSKIMIGAVSQKIVVSGRDNFIINIAAAILAGVSVVLFSYLCTREIRRFSPIDAIHSGETGERYSRKGVIHLSRSGFPATLFLALNDILSRMKNYVSMIIIFILGTLLVIIPVNTINTLCSDDLITTFNMIKSDHIISQELLFDPNENNVEKVERQFSEVREMFAENGIDVDVFQEIMFRSNVRKGDKLTNSLSFQGMGGVTADMYVYLEGTPPQNIYEVALTYLTAEQIGAKIGDSVEKALSRGLYSDTEKQHETAEKINDKANEIEHYVSRIITASREEFLSLEVEDGEFYLADLVQNIAAYYSEKSALVKTEFMIGEYQNCLLSGDFDRSVEALQNLMENAMKYGDGKRIDLLFSNEDEVVFVSVRNSGCTLDKSDLPHIFESFWRGRNSEKVEGSGLGLYICRELMHKMKGDVFAEMNDGVIEIIAIFRRV